MQNNKHLLFCFPNAGGTADFYNEIEKKCEKDIQFFKFDYPGHGLRMKERLCNDFDEISNDFLPKISQILIQNPHCDYSLMGYSMGSVTLFDILKKIVDTKCINTPKAVFISAHQPSSIVKMKSIVDDSADEWVRRRTIEFGGVDPKLINNNSFWRVYLPIFKTDYRMIDNYDFDSGEFRTGIPAVVFYSEDDTPYQEMKQWNKYFVGGCEFIRYSGSHFFIKDNYENMAEIIKNKLLGEYNGS